MNTTPITNSDFIIADIAKRKEEALSNAIAQVEVTFANLSLECFNRVVEYLQVNQPGNPQQFPDGRFFAFKGVLPNLTVSIFSVRK